MNIIYFAHNVEDAAVLKRARHLAERGAEVQIVGFSRFTSTPKNASTAIVLGRTYDGKFAQRAFEIIKGMSRVSHFDDLLSQADAIICRNLEALIVGSWARNRSGRDLPIHYECLDIHGKMLGSGPASKALRLLERTLLNRATSLITSSNAFVTEYFAPIQNYRGRVNLLENKLLTSDFAPEEFSARTPASPPWIIGWFGIIRCRKSLLMLNEIANERNVTIRIAGRVAQTQIPDFDEIISASAQLEFLGAYEAKDIPSLFGGCHFIWSVDYYEEGQNSAWLLPNRLYDSLAAKRVPIALKTVETGHWLIQHEAGKLVSDPVKDLKEFFAALTVEDFDSLQDQVRAIPNDAIFHTNDSLNFLFEAASGNQVHDDR
ncbi:glycosyltransferase [Asticcacaulis sp. DXS10W]|uniref:Glycosyltransferase n=1 Tax=Asticcacaulis currens TaxID=2984210 RepID=A0ABT5IA62_9CAUL|nr:glycosyltransferase [Asticcacaulis currens]MDC7692770.1 glycosyltransferase [Asticcacaulis currens]